MGKLIDDIMKLRCTSLPPCDEPNTFSGGVYWATIESNKIIHTVKRHILGVLGSGFSTYEYDPGHQTDIIVNKIKQIFEEEI